MSRIHHVPHFMRRQNDHPPVPEKDQPPRVVPDVPADLQERVRLSPTHGMSSSSSRSRIKPNSITLPPPLAYTGLSQYPPPGTSPLSISGSRQRDFAEEDKSEHTFRGAGSGSGSGSGHGAYMGSSQDDKHRSDGTKSPRSHSPTGEDGPKGRYGQLPENRRRTQNVEDGDGRRRRTNSDRSKIVSLLGEEAPFMLNHPTRQQTTSEQYPGVILGSFAGGGFDGQAMGFGEHSVGIDEHDFLDFSQPRMEGRGRHDSVAGPAPNIAPWLTDDPVQDSRSSSAERSGNSTPADYGALPRFKRGGTDPGLFDGSAASSRSSSHAQIFPVPPPDSFPSNSVQASRHGSSDSVQTLSAYNSASQNKRSLPADVFVAPGGSRGSIAGSRLKLGVSGSGDSGKKKGFLGGFLKRKPTGVIMPRES